MTVLNILVGVKQRSCFTLAKRTVCHIAYLFDMRYKGLHTNVTISFTKIFTRVQMEGATFENLADSKDLSKDSQKRITLSEDPYRSNEIKREDIRLDLKNRHNNYVRLKKYLVNYKKDGILRKFQLKFE